MLSTRSNWRKLHKYIIFEMQNNSIPDFPPLKWSLKVILIRDEKFFQQLLSKKDSQLSCLWEITDFANVKQYSTQTRAYLIFFGKFTVFTESLFSSTTNIGSPKQTLKLLLKNSWHNIETASFGKCSTTLYFTNIQREYCMWTGFVRYSLIFFPVFWF